MFKEQNTRHPKNTFNFFCSECAKRERTYSFRRTVIGIIKSRSKVCIYDVLFKKMIFHVFDRFLNIYIYEFHNSYNISSIRWNRTIVKSISFWQRISFDLFTFQNNDIAKWIPNVFGDSLYVSMLLFDIQTCVF